MTRRSFWAWGLESDEPTSQQRKDMAAAMSRKYGVPLESPPAPTVDRLDLRVPRVTPIPELARFAPPIPMTGHSTATAAVSEIVFGHLTATSLIP